MKIPDTREERRALIKRIASSSKTDDIRPGRPISEELWKMPWPEDPEGLSLKGLLEDRGEGR
jgi:hypothetical protein